MLAMLRITGTEIDCGIGCVEYVQLSGPIPPGISNLASLEELDLWGNQFTSLPPEFGNLENLKEQWLGVNQLASLPPEIGNLSSLQQLHLARNQLSGFIPAFLSNLEVLSLLALYGNQP